MIAQANRLSIVFAGNRQLQTLECLTRRLVAPRLGITTAFIDTTASLSASAQARIAQADILVRPFGAEGEDAAGSARVVRVPVPEARYLWPFSLVPHPLAAAECPAYPPEYNDRYLNNLIQEGLAPDQALARWLALDVPAMINLGRLRDSAQAALAAADAACGTDCVGLIAGRLAQEKLFCSATQWDGALAGHLAGHVCDAIGLDRKFGHWARKFLRGAGCAPVHTPIHPSVARFFGLSWAEAATRYPYLAEGWRLRDEYVRHYMTAAWNPALAAAIAAAREGAPGALAALRAALRESPRAAAGFHEMARLHEEAGDLDAALEAARRAAMLGNDGAHAFQLGRLLLRSGDQEGARKAFWRAVTAEPCHGAAWAALRALLEAEKRWRRAFYAATRALRFAADPAPEREAYDRLRARLAQRRRGRPGAAPIRAVSGTNTGPGPGPRPLPRPTSGPAALGRVAMQEPRVANLVAS